MKALDLRCNPPAEVAVKLLKRGEIVSLSQCSGQHIGIQAAVTINVIQIWIHLTDSCLSTLQVKSYKAYVKREIENQSRLRHPLIITIKEVRFLQLL